MIELSKKLMTLHPEGPLFRGPLGMRPFSSNGVRCRFRRLRAKLPHLKGVVAYCLRHSFATDALANGVPVATVAELMGHKNIRMVQEHYAHLAEKTQHLRDAAKQATGG
jgi:integrase